MSTWTASAGFFLVIWLVLLASGGSSLLRDPGTFWHLALGERFLQTGTLPTHDAFTFTFTGQRWLSLQWLGEAAMAAAYRAGGWDTVVLLTATLLAAMYAWLAARLMRSGLHWLPAAVLIAIVIAASSHHFHARPHVATIAFLSLTMAWLCDVDSGQAGLRRLWLLVPLVALWTNVHGGVLGGLMVILLAAGGWCLAAMLGWPSPLRRRGDWLALASILLGCAAAVLVNPYGLEMPRAWLTIMAMPLPELIQEHRPLSIWRPESWMVAAAAAMYLGMLVSAIRGARGLRAPMNAGHASRVPPREGRHEGVGSRFSRRVESAPNEASTRRENRLPTPFCLRVLPCVTWLIPAVWLLLAMTRVRHAPLFSITAAVAMAAMLPYTRFAAWLAQWDLFDGGSGATRETSAVLPSPPLGADEEQFRRSSSIRCVEHEHRTSNVQRPTSNEAGTGETDFEVECSMFNVGRSGPSPRRGEGGLRSALMTGAAMALPLIALALQLLGVRVPVVGRGWVEHDRQHWPTDLLAELKAIESERPGRRVFNTLDFGGFLSFHTPALRTFIDDRCELLGTEFLSGYAEAEATRPERIDKWAEQYGFDVALVRAGSPFDRHLRASPQWEMIGASDAATLFRAHP